MSSPSDRSPSFARRALPAVAVAGATGALLLALDHPSGASSATVVAGGTDLSSTAPGSGSSVTTAGAGGSTVVTTVPPVPSTTPATTPSTAPATDAPSTAAPTPTAPSGDSSSASGTCEGTVVTGPEVDTRWGIVQVAASIAADGQICDVQAVQYPADHRKSLAINQRALPVIHDRVIEAQSASFDVVSGATVTCDGYAMSLQAILDAR